MNVISGPKAEWTMGLLYRTPPFNEFSGKLPKCSVYRGIVYD